SSDVCSSDLSHQRTGKRIGMNHDDILAAGDIRHPRALGWMIVGLFLALGMPHPGRIVPGGPFLSVSGDLVPIALCLTILTVCVTWFRGETLAGKVFLLVVMLSATVLLARLLESILLFWFRPYARGVLIDW